MNRLNQLRALLALFRDPAARRAFRRWKPFSITSYKLARQLKRHVPHLGTVIDAGANVGQFARSMLETYPDAALIAFEPLPDVAARLREHLADTPRAHVVEAAVGNTSGTLTFYPNAYSLASSARPMTEAADAHFPGLVQHAPIEVQAVTLDGYFDGRDLPRPLLLKLDLQGFEREALAGATALLRRVDAIVLEMAFVHVYRDEALFDELHATLTDAGFTLHAPLDVLPDAQGGIVQMDALYLNTSSHDDPS